MFKQLAYSRKPARFLSPAPAGRLVLSWWRRRARRSVRYSQQGNIVPSGPEPGDVSASLEYAVAALQGTSDIVVAVLPAQRRNDR